MNNLGNDMLFGRHSAYGLVAQLARLIHRYERVVVSRWLHLSHCARRLRLWKPHGRCPNTFKLAAIAAAFACADGEPYEIRLAGSIVSESVQVGPVSLEIYASGIRIKSTMVYGSLERFTLPLTLVKTRSIYVRLAAPGHDTVAVVADVIRDTAWLGSVVLTRARRVRIESVQYYRNVGQDRTRPEAIDVLINNASTATAIIDSIRVHGVSRLETNCAAPAPLHDLVFRVMGVLSVHDSVGDVVVIDSHGNSAVIPMRGTYEQLPCERRLLDIFVAWAWPAPPASHQKLRIELPLLEATDGVQRLDLVHWERVTVTLYYDREMREDAVVRTGWPAS